jgi:biopolymer transport protein ExbD
MATLSDYSGKDAEITLRIDPNVAYRHVAALQGELQKNNVERVVVTLSQ